VARFLQEYTEPQPHPSVGSAIFSESQTFNLGSTDAQSVLLPLTEGCLTNNTGVPIVIVCTKVQGNESPLVDNTFFGSTREVMFQSTNASYVFAFVNTLQSDHINSLEREQDYQEETFDYIQQSLRTICLKCKGAFMSTTT
jgi:dynein light intermediate chain 1